jgi:transposase-like protein
MAGKKGMRHYAREVKLAAVRMFLEEGMTQAAIAAELGLRNDRRVEAWMRQYRREGEEAFTKRVGRPQRVWSEAARIRQLEMENALLKKYRTELRKNMLAKRNIGSYTTTGRNTK